VKEVNGGSKNLHLRPNSRHPIPVSWQEQAYGTQLLSAVFDVPDLIVKVSESRKIRKS
jgi:hypothetical protein